MRSSARKSALDRLRRIEGQVRGIARMLEEDRYCMDVLAQVEAARAALRKVSEGVLKDHVEGCLDTALRDASLDVRREKVNEVLKVLEQFGR